MIERYYLKADHQTEWEEVTREQFIAAEQAAGFRSKFGSNHPATGGFNGKGMRGRVDYVIDDNNDDAPAAPERGEWEVECQKVLVATPQRLRVVIRETTGVRRVIVSEDSPARFEQALKDFDQIVNEHNQHSTLIAQRERLIDLLKQTRAFICEATWTETKPRKREAEGLVAQIDAVITTSEQEGRRNNDDSI